ncbi:S1C family serine protease [Rothia sp. ZJ1223]|uniref:S1C family serine protease n=1 Tax=Rothia sp. ZJ1223 TaxID=2811098 RepID=UPI001958744B|nr:trypsin-like peptidase domain-containing protein [Rothia sp. ZJ1223]MBM7050858.1 trypsin-like peptidase domain-containing protein [Rothia sp. ZJ1223]
MTDNHWNQSPTPQNQGNPHYGQPAHQQPASFQPEPARRKSNLPVVLGTAALAALIGAGVGGGVATFATSETSPVASLTSGSTRIVNNTDSVTTVTAAAEKATPSVVTLGVTTPSESGSGSGIILDDRGHILTNTHVVTLGGKAAKPTIEVKLSDGTVKSATIVGTDPTSDLAVIKIDPAGVNLTPASIGNSDELNVGDTSVAIGAPLGLENTVTDGIISTLTRTIEVASSEAPEGDTSNSLPNQASPFHFELPGQSQSQRPTSIISLNVLQTDAAVNPGNSGGALVNSNGEVIGVNVAIASADKSSTVTSGNIGVGFAIPINYAKRVAQEIIDNGAATHGYLGASVSTSPANNDSSENFGDGAYIQAVVPGQAAEKSGLREGDIIVSFDGRPITEATELTASVRQAAAGQTVTAGILRGNTVEKVEITLGNSADAS